MAKAIFYNIPATGHVNPSLPVVSELVQAGEQVIYYAASEHRSQVEASGARYRRYPNVPDDYFHVNGLNGRCPPKTALALARTTRATLPELAEQARAEDPDYVMYDSECPWGYLIARMLSVPSVSSATMMVFSRFLAFRTRSMRGLVTSSLRGLPEILRYFGEMAAIGREHGVRPVGYPDIFSLPAETMICYITQSFQPGGRRLARSVHFVGPSIRPRAGEEAFPFEALGSGPLIYICLGTINSNNPAFYRTCIRAYSGLPWQVVMSIGPHSCAGDLGPVAGNIVVRASVPQLALLERAAVFVNHGGMNSLQEGLSYGVPMIVVPQQPEQQANGRRLAQLGAGVMLSTRRLTASRLRDVTERVLADGRDRSGAVRLRDEMGTAGGYRRAAQAILAAVRSP